MIAGRSQPVVHRRVVLEVLDRRFNAWDATTGMVQTADGPGAAVDLLSRGLAMVGEVKLDESGRMPLAVEGGVGCGVV